jgi:hypothetical protein
METKKRKRTQLEVGESPPAKSKFDHLKWASIDTSETFLDFGDGGFLGLEEVNDYPDDIFYGTPFVHFCAPFSFKSLKRFLFLSYFLAFSLT